MLEANANAAQVIALAGSAELGDLPEGIKPKKAALRPERTVNDHSRKGWYRPKAVVHFRITRKAAFIGYRVGNTVFSVGS